MKFGQNKHIINYIRNLLSDSTDSKIGFETKVDVINNGIKMYSKYIYNYKTKTVSIENDGMTYKVDSNINFIQSVKYVGEIDCLVEGYDYFIDENNNVIIQDGNSEDIEVLYDKQYPSLYVSDELNLSSSESGVSEYEVEITVGADNIDLFVVNDYVIVKDDTNEETVKIISKTEDSITIELQKSYVGGYLISNSTVKNFEVIGIYSQYYLNYISTNGNGNIKSQTWEQGDRKRQVIFDSSNSSSQKTLDNQFYNYNLDLFVNVLKDDVNYKFKKIEGFKILRNYK